MAAVRKPGPGDGRPELGAMFARLSRGMIAAELPLLQAHDLSMWGYVVLSALAHGPASTQLELARAVGCDKTRLIAHLDTLEAEGLIERRPDPSDRRAHLVSLTAAGERRRAAIAADIRALEERLLDALPATHRRALETALPRLTEELPALLERD